MAAVGTRVGVPLALDLGQLVETLLFPTQPTDPVVLARASLLLCVVALGAGWIPARKASSIDAMVASRFD